VLTAAVAKTHRIDHKSGPRARLGRSSGLREETEVVTTVDAKGDREFLDQAEPMRREVLAHC
jgi:hypothetical protein